MDRVQSSQMTCLVWWDLVIGALFPVAAQRTYVLLGVACFQPVTIDPRSHESTHVLFVWVIFRFCPANLCISSVLTLSAVQVAPAKKKDDAGPADDGSTELHDPVDVDTETARKQSTNKKTDMTLTADLSCFPEGVRVVLGPLLDPQVEWNMDVYTGLVVLWSWDHDAKKARKRRARGEGHHSIDANGHHTTSCGVVIRRLAMCIAALAAFALQIIVPIVLIRGAQVRQFDFTDYPLCTTGSEDDDLRHVDDDDGLIGKRVCYDSNGDRVLFACFWMAVLTTSLLSVLAQFYVEFKKCLRMLIQIHHFASAGRHWGVSLVIIGVVHAVSVVLAFGLTYIVITSQSDPYYEYSPNVKQTLMDVVAILYLTTIDEVLFAFLSHTGWVKLFPTAEDIQETYRTTPPSPDESTRSWKARMWVYYWIALISGFIFIPGFMFSFMASYLGWATRCDDELAFPKMTDWERRMCNQWYPCQSEHPDLCNCCYGARTNRFLFGPPFNHTTCVSCTRVKFF